MPPATRSQDSQQRAAVALRPRLAAALILAALAPGTAHASPLPSFTFSPPAPYTSEPVAFASTSTGATAPERWDLDGDLACDDATGPAATRAFWPAGSYEVTLCVTDGTDRATVTRRLTVHNRPPVAAITYAPLTPLTGDSVTLAIERLGELTAPVVERPGR